MKLSQATNELTQIAKQVQTAVEPKKLLRVAWVVESTLYFVLAFIVIIWKTEQVDGLAKLSPYLFGLIMGQGAAGWSGSNIKRFTESLKIKAQNGGRGEQEAA